MERLQNTPTLDNIAVILGYFIILEIWNILSPYWEKHKMHQIFRFIKLLPQTWAFYTCSFHTQIIPNLGKGWAGEVCRDCNPCVLYNCWAVAWGTFFTWNKGLYHYGKYGQCIFLITMVITIESPQQLSRSLCQNIYDSNGQMVVSQGRTTQSSVFCSFVPATQVIQIVSGSC